MAMAACLDPLLDTAVIEAMVQDGPAVDGVSLRRVATIDALGLDVHHDLLNAIRSLISTSEPAPTQRLPPVS